jgi:hypothetical protein
MLRAIFGIGAGAAQETPAQDARPTTPIPDITEQQRAFLERRKETTNIKTLERDFRKRHPESACTDVRLGHPGCVGEVTTTEKVRDGAADNRCCSGGKSKVHLLECSHTVYTDDPTYCGKSCFETDYKDNAPLHCILCFRDGLTRQKKKYPWRWHDLLLPSYQDPEAEAEDVEKYGIIMRKAEPVYIDPVHDFVLLPRSPVLVALIRAMEWLREQQLKTRMPYICAEKDYSDLIATTANENIDALLSNHQLLCYVDLTIVAAIALKLTLSFEGTEVQYGLIAAAFDASQINIQGQCQVKARAILQDLVAHDKTEAILKKAPQKYRHNNKFKKDSIDVLARRIRTRALKDLKMSLQQRQELYNYIIAASIQQAMALHKISITMKEVCDGMGIEYDGLLAEDKEAAPPARARAARAAKKQKQSIAADAFSKADLTERTVRLYVASQDWKKPQAAKKDKREKMKEKKIKAEQDTKDIDVAMAGL